MSEQVLTEQGQACLQSLLAVWMDFERNLNRVPLIARLERGKFDKQDYLKLLLNWRQQVIEGSRWISLCASSFDKHHSDVRSKIIGHAREEHRDFEMLERDYVTAGGKLEDIQSAERNLGTEALHAFLMYRASRPNPFDMIGAMWIIEGLGMKMSTGWAEQIERCTRSDGHFTKFMKYHGKNDEHHMEELYSLIDRACETEDACRAIIRTAKVVGRLYCLQLEEVDHDE